jgi:hypothetical protein
MAMSKVKEFHQLLELMPAQVNPCGDCQMCCVAPAIEQRELEPSDPIKPKPACAKCPMLAEKGCSIYNKRPWICKGYMCLYAMGYTDVRPDQNNVAWTLQPDMLVGGVMLVGHSMDVEDTFRCGKAIRFMRKAERSKMFTCTVVKDSKKVVRLDFDGTFPDLEADIDESDYLKANVIKESERLTKHSIHQTSW